MRFTAITALLSCVAMAQPQPFDLGQSKPGEDEIRPRLMRSDGPPRLSRIPPDDFAFFEAFPSNGSGTNGVCSTTAPTGAKGETLTFTRATNATCTKTAAGGLATTGIANGDLVVLSSNVARVEYDANGTLGLLVESSRTNSCLRSEAIDNAVWAKTGVGVAAPTVTADYATAPDNAATAERVQVAACPTVGNASIVVQSMARAASAESVSVFLRGTSGNGSVTLCHFGAAGNCVTASFVSTSWTRAVLENKTGAATSYIQVGCENRTASYTGATDTGAADFLMWGAQLEGGGAAYVTSYIPTTSAAVTRSAETATFPGASLPANPYSLAVSFYPPTATTQGDLFYGNAGSTSGVGFFFVASLLRTQNCSSGCATFSPAYAPTALTTTRLATSSTGGQQQTFVNGSSLSGPTATAAAAAPWATATGIGPGIGQPDAIISRICVDSDPSRCR